MTRTDVGRMAVLAVAAAVPAILNACIINGSNLVATGNSVNADVAVGGQGPSASPSSSLASGSVTGDSSAPQGDWRDVFKDYDIPTGSMSVKASVVLRKRGVYPPTKEMFRVTKELQPVAPSTAYIRTIAVVPKRSDEAPGIIDSDGISTLAVAEVGNWWIKELSSLDQQTAVDLTVLSFDGSYSKNRVLTTNYFNLLDDAPLGIPLVLRANVRGFLGYSLPFVLAPSEHTIEGKYIPVETDVVVAP